MVLETRAVAPFFKNGFLVASGSSRDAILVDPGDEVSSLLAIATKRALSVKHILLTHAHMDHLAGVEAARAATGAPVGVHRDDLFLYEAAEEQGRVFGYDVEQPQPPDLFLEAGQRLHWDGLSVIVHHTPGHSPGGVCLEVGPTESGRTELLVGDTLFAGSIGRTDLPGGDYKTLMASIRTVLLAFPDETVVHPGHGPSTTIGDERRSNPFLR
jgi:hydroxyacylglutathione hydrolase